MNKELLIEARAEVTAEIDALNDERNNKISEINADYDSKIAEKQLELKVIDKLDARFPAIEVEVAPFAPVEEVVEAEPVEVVESPNPNVVQ